MPVQYGLTAVNFNLIVEKGKAKANGLYSFRGVVYRVQNNRVTHFAADGKILERFGAATVQVGKYEAGIGGDARAKKIMKTCLG